MLIRAHEAMDLVREHERRWVEGKLPEVCGLICREAEKGLDSAVFEYDEEQDPRALIWALRDLGFVVALQCDGAVLIEWNWRL